MAALLSLLLFGEALPPLWWAGYSCILLGLALLTNGQRPPREKDE